MARRAARVLHTGGLVAYPTEGVYGLGCDPWNPAAVSRLLALKRRDVAAGLILLSDRASRIWPLIEGLDAAMRRRLLATWPGPVTWLVPASSRVPAWIRGAHREVAVRVTAHPDSVRLAAAFGRPLVSTSANIRGHKAGSSALAVRRGLGFGVDLVLGGAVGGLGGATEIRDARSGAVVRSAPPRACRP